MYNADVERLEFTAKPTQGYCKYIVWLVEEYKVEGPHFWFGLCLKILSWGTSFPQKLREAKVRMFLNLKQESIGVQEYNLMFTQQSHYTQEMVANMRSMVILFMYG